SSFALHLRRRELGRRHGTRGCSHSRYGACLGEKCKWIIPDSGREFCEPGEDHSLARQRYREALPMISVHQPWALRIDKTFEDEGGWTTGGLYFRLRKNLLE